MSDFINTIDELGDEVVFQKYVDNTLTEFKDNTITNVGERAFGYRLALETIDLPNVTTVGDSAFSQCEELKTVNLPLVTYAGSHAFSGVGLENIYFPSVETAKTQCFNGMPNLISVKLPKLSRAEKPFTYCYILRVADFSALSFVTESMFDNCKSLIALILRRETRCGFSASAISASAIDTGIGYIYVPSNLIEEYKTYFSNANMQIYVNQFRALEDYTVDGTITGELDWNKIEVSTSREILTDIVQSIEHNATSIGAYVFYQCSLLKTAKFPNATSVGLQAFSGCNELTTVDLPNVTSIGERAFSGCGSLTTIDLPKVTSIGAYAFNGCSILTTVILRSETVCTLSNTNAFTSCDHIFGTSNSTYNPTGAKDGYIYVPRALLDSYKSATNWSSFASQFRAIEDYPEICGEV